MPDETATPESAPAQAAPASPGYGDGRQISVRIGLGSALFQGALVVFGVLLGFLITEWQSEQARRAEANLALDSIIEEIAANRDAIIAAHAYHGEHIALIDKATAEKTPLDVRSFPRGFIAPAQTANAAWTSAGETGALSHLPFEKVMALSRVYSQQAAYQQQQATVATVIYTNLFEGGAEAVVRQATGLRAIISTFYYREQQLEAAYSGALASAGREGGEPRPHPAGS